MARQENCALEGRRTTDQSGRQSAPTAPFQRPIRGGGGFSTVTGGGTRRLACPRLMSWAPSGATGRLTGWNWKQRSRTRRSPADLRCSSPGRQRNEADVGSKYRRLGLSKKNGPKHGIETSGKCPNSRRRPSWLPLQCRQQLRDARRHRPRLTDSSRLDRRRMID